MPVTARLSRLFYERLGEQVVNELVEWLNQVDAAYKSDLRELNDVNFARFESKLDQRIAGLRSELKGDVADLKGGIAGLEGRMNVGFAEMRAGMERALKEQGRWFIGAFAALVATLVAAVALLVDIRLRLP